jgi:hypothetical protein
MIAKYSLTAYAKCPANGAKDIYRVTFTVNRMIQVEELVAACAEYKDIAIFQEELTEKLAEKFSCSVRTIGHHGTVQTEVGCGSRSLISELLAICKDLVDNIDPNGDDPTRDTIRAREIIATADGVDAIVEAYRKYHNIDDVNA